jgi:peptide/nickel transport system ATP-binding protein
MTNLLLNVQNLQVTFKGSPSPVIKNVNLTIARQETIALVGESGGGKSLTALSIMQLLPLGARINKESNIYLEQKDLLDLPEVKMRKIRGRRIALIPQEPVSAFNPVMTIGEQVSEAVRLHVRKKGHTKYQTVIELLTSVGLPDPERCYYQYPLQLSGGMLQRVMIAMAVAAKPDLLIADEATTSLDVTVQAQILELLQRLKQETGMSILFITHDLALVKIMAQRIFIIKAGEIVEQSSVEQFFSGPKHPYSQELLANTLHRYNPLTANSLAQLAEVPISSTKQSIVSQKNPLLRVDHLKVYFPIQKGFFKRTVGWVKAVDGISFDLKGGKTLAIVGESGSGKTTVGKTILRLIQPSAGSIVFEGKNLSSISRRELHQVRKELQIIFQDPFSSMDPRMMVGEIIAEGIVALGLAESEQALQDKIDDLLKKVQLPIESKYRYPHEFSGGQRQRICIARALAVSPRLIVCDEPTSALDVSAQMNILQLLKTLQRELGLAYLFITHNLAVVGYLAHEVAVMHEGRIVEHGPVSQVLTSPQHAYTQSLLASAVFV